MELVRRLCKIQKYYEQDFSQSKKVILADQSVNQGIL